MGSRFLEDLERKIADEIDEVAIDCLLAEKAAYLARLGKSSMARNILNDLAAKNLSRPNIRTSICINIAEGIDRFYSDMGGAAHDRFQRAKALSEAAGLSNLRASAAAWLAHLAFSRHDFSLMAKEVKLALRLASPESHVCLSRVSLVVAQALQLANQSQANQWYLKARNHALQMGDETTISSVIHNMAVIGVASARQQVFQWNLPPKEALAGAFSVDSTRNFDNLVGIASLKSLTPILRAQALSLESHFNEALSLYCEYMESALSQGMGRIECWLLADRAWCRFNLGMKESAIEDVENALLRLSNVQVDDLAATHSRLAQIFYALGKEEQSATHRKVAEGLWLEFCDLQSEIAFELRDV